jgi:NADH dehydrogenase/NADH:ubiquinone oxidoreductase subunit G
MDNNTITLTVNENEVRGQKGQTVLDVFRDNDIHIPTLPLYR